MDKAQDPSCHQQDEPPGRSSEALLHSLWAEEGEDRQQVLSPGVLRAQGPPGPGLGASGLTSCSAAGESRLDLTMNFLRWERNLQRESPRSPLLPPGRQRRPRFEAGSSLHQMSSNSSFDDPCPQSPETAFSKRRELSLDERPPVWSLVLIGYSERLSLSLRSRERLEAGEPPPPRLCVSEPQAHSPCCDIPRTGRPGATTHVLHIEEGGCIGSSGGIWTLRPAF